MGGRDEVVGYRVTGPRHEPRAAERRTKDSAERRAGHHTDRYVACRLGLEQGVASTAQPVCVTLRYVIRPQARDRGQHVIVLTIIECHVAYLLLSAATAGVSSSFCASAARARDNRCRSASGVVPHTAAASAGVK